MCIHIYIYDTIVLSYTNAISYTNACAHDAHLRTPPWSFPGRSFRPGIAYVYIYLFFLLFCQSLGYGSKKKFVFLFKVEKKNTEIITFRGEKPFRFEWERWKLF